MNILIVLGTRPEAIKLAPVILELRKKYNVIVCNTEQQKDLSNQTLRFFGIDANIKLDVMMPNQTLAGVQSSILHKLSNVYTCNDIDATIVQGDTMTVFCGALVSFYNKVPVFHVEAGLRSYDMAEPFPEEAIRQMVTRITDLHLAPTPQAVDCLVKEGVSKNKIFMTGNTVIDALSCLSEQTLNDAKKALEEKNIKLNDKLVLVTAHRRENHGHRLDSILDSIKKLSEMYTDHQFVFPVHPNPNVKDKVYNTLNNLENIIVTEALDYPLLVSLLKQAKLILTDSGGIQEEAPSFGCPMLVMRLETERKEGIAAGFAKLVGTDKAIIIAEASKILSLDKSQTRLDGSKNPYGDGTSADKIAKIIGDYFNE